MRNRTKEELLLDCRNTIDQIRKLKTKDLKDSDYPFGMVDYYNFDDLIEDIDGILNESKKD